MTLLEIRDIVFPIGIAFVCFHFAGKKKWPWLPILGVILLIVGAMNAIRLWLETWRRDSRSYDHIIRRRLDKIQL